MHSNPQDDTPTYNPYGVDATMSEAYDVDHISIKVMLPVDGELRLGTAKGRKLDDLGVPIGNSNNKYMLDTSLYEVDFSDSPSQTMAANVIVENMFAKISDNGYYTPLLKEIVDFKKTDEAIENPQDGVPTPKTTMG